MLNIYDNIEIGVYVSNGIQDLKQAHIGDAGYDIRCIKADEILPGQTKIFKTGIYFDTPIGWEIQVRSRSGLAAKNSIHVLNGPGTIDSSFTDELGIILHNSGNDPFYFKPGDRIAQIVVKRVPTFNFVKLDSRPEKKDRNGGFGSSGLQ